MSTVKRGEVPTLFESPSHCCGCGACAAGCPNGAITMSEGKDGFVLPVINSDLCIGCGACTRACGLNRGIGSNSAGPFFAAAGRDDVSESASGGVFGAVAREYISSGGVAYGAAYEREGNSLRVLHRRAASVDELLPLLNSKYVQSDVCGLYKQVKADLKKDRPVLFIGTSCQVAGLKKYIKDVPDNLYLVDLICHGVPSQQMLHEHIAYVTSKQKIRQISFRKGNDIVISLAGNNFSYEANVWEDPYKDLYIKGFVDCLIYRPSCYQCHFAQPNRVSDITIGDFWGLRNAEKLPSESKNGISVLLPVSNKGMELLSATKPSLYIVERSVDEAVRGNTQLRHPSIQGRRSRLFGLLYPTFPFDIAMNLAVADHKATRKIKDFIHSLRHVC